MHPKGEDVSEIEIKREHNSVFNPGTIKDRLIGLPLHADVSHVDCVMTRLLEEAGRGG